MKLKFLFLGMLGMTLPSFIPFNGAHAQAVTSCTLLISYPAGEIVHEDGDCQSRHAPMSSFKFPLAVMGFDSGILQNENLPVWASADSKFPHEVDEKIGPAAWLKESRLWYSQELTTRLGALAFNNYVTQFAYGNQDVKGGPGKPGHTHSWLVSSLQISPQEQAQFVRKFLDRDLKVSEAAYDLTIRAMPVFPSSDWIVHGKTGSGHLLTAEGARDSTKPFGWFVGWAERGAETLIFVKFLQDEKAHTKPVGLELRGAFLEELPTLARDLE
jgi:beta-lactamase class D